MKRLKAKAKGSTCLVLHAWLLILTGEKIFFFFEHIRSIWGAHWMLGDMVNTLTNTFVEHAYLRMHELRLTR